ncbi:MAG: NADP-dependent malic enzyme [candidate division WOR-3 bacterium]
MQDENFLKRKAEKPFLLSEKLHPIYRGKIEIIPKVPVSKFEYFAIWYTPGVAAACKRIAQDRDLSFSMTSRWNTIAVISDGTRVLGLGNIGPEAALPVMEGKALLFKALGGVDAIPICLQENNPDKIIEIVKSLEPSFGGINLEDIEKPKCFYILEKLRSEMSIPVWHDDQQGTATIILAGLINALKIVNKKINEVKIFMLGAGAAGVATLKLLMLAGANAENIILADRKGVIHRNREDLEEKFGIHAEIIRKTNGENVKGDYRNGIKGADVVIALSTPGPGVIQKEDIKNMAKDAIVFACANPVPEIWPWEAKDGGAKIVATGRSDFPNQVNNSLVFPGIFRGVLDVSAKTITDTMCVEVADEIAKFAEEKGISEEYIIPRMDEWELYPRIAARAADAATKENIARNGLLYGEELSNARKIILRAQELFSRLEEEGYIKDFSHENH